MALTKVPSNLDAAISVTQSSGDNSTKVATTSYVDTAISALSDSAPAALNTLNEIAAALGDDANYASTTTAAIAAKLPLSGGTMSGDLNMNSQDITNLDTLTSAHFITRANVNGTGQGGAFIPSGKRLGFDQSGTRSWTQYAAGGNLLFASGDGNGAIQANNFTGVTLALSGTSTLNGTVTIATGATTGSRTIKDNYANGSLANQGFLRSSGGNYWTYGAYQDGSANWKSAVSVALERSIYAMDEDSAYWSFAPAQTVAIGSDLTTQPVEKIRFDLQNGNVGIGTNNPFSKLQTGNNTFSGGHGMYSNARVGISNHGSLTGLMLASTYNDASHPDYGLVFVQGPSTSSYNVWSISPDGPAKGTGLNFHYGAQATNIHGASHKRITFKGDGSVIIGSGGTTTYNAALQVKGNITTTVDGDAYQLYYTESRDFITHSGAAAIIKQIDNDASTAMIQFRAWNNSPLMTMMNSGNVSIGNGAASTVSRLKTIGASNTSSNYTFEACNASGNTRFLVRNDGETNFYNASNQPSFQVASTGIKSFLGQNAFPTVFYKSGGYSEQTVTRFSMTMIGNTAYVIQFAGMANGAAHVRLIGSHWTQGYGTGRESYIFTDSYTSISELNQYNHSTATSGGWTITRASTPSANSNLVITKTAGNYVGSFVAMIEITSQWPLTIASIA